MSDKSKQNISELMDGELEKDCSRFLLKRMQSDPALSEKWDNYHLMRSYLQQSKEAPLMHDLGSQVVSQLQDAQAEVEVVNEQNRTKSAWYKPLTGMAIAASVAWLAIINVAPNGGLQDPLINETVAFKTAEQLIDPPDAMQARVEQVPQYTRYPSLTPRVQQYIIDSNGVKIESLPSYYNMEYMKQLEQQLKQQQAQKIAE